VNSSLRYFGCAVGFAFGVLWMTLGLGSAILCLLLAGLGYGAVFVAGRAQADGLARRRPNATSETDAPLLDDFELDYEPAGDATSPLAAEAESAEYGWPLQAPEITHTQSR
jgi:uncharacterized membrane protein